ncbi:MAG: hypothetical protein LQ343_002418 [Gyalolechia ehrenbergii]|nr:MAG: hypothetical protein LQ343_002418 [Gyalolechia ehrenbergii]
MDLISVLDIAASVASIVELSTGCIKSLLDLRASYQITDMNVQVSIAQLSTLRAALMQISAWEFESTDFIPSNLEMDFNLSLTSCKALIDGLNDQSKVYLTAMRSNLKQAVRVSARKFRHGSVGGRTARGRFDDGEMPVVRGKGKQSTIPPDILAEPHVFNAASSDRGFQEYTARTQLTASYESLPRPSMDWDSDAIEVLTSPLALPVNPSVGLDMDKHKQRIEGQPRYGNLQMPSFFKARGTSGSLSSRDSSSAALNLPGVEKKIAETQILLTGNAKTSALFLQRSMKLAFGHNYTKVTKEAFRISILRKMVQNMRDLLSSMRDLGFSLDSDSEPHAHTILTTMLTEIGESLPANVGTALAVLWKDPAVLDTFRQGGIQWDWDDPE